MILTKVSSLLRVVTIAFLFHHQCWSLPVPPPPMMAPGHQGPPGQPPPQHMQVLHGQLQHVMPGQQLLPGHPPPHQGQPPPQLGQPPGQPPPQLGQPPPGQPPPQLGQPPPPGHPGQPQPIQFPPGNPQHPLGQPMPHLGQPPFPQPNEAGRQQHNGPPPPQHPFMPPPPDAPSPFSLDESPALPNNLAPISPPHSEAAGQSQSFPEDTFPEDEIRVLTPDEERVVEKETVELAAEMAEAVVGMIEQDEALAIDNEMAEEGFPEILDQYNHSWRNTVPVILTLSMLIVHCII